MTKKVYLSIDLETVVTKKQKDYDIRRISIVHS
jgi:hypothetical protein